MFQMFPADLSEAMQKASLRTKLRKSRLRIEVGGQSLPVLRRWDGGFAVDATRAAHLRGLVDLYDGSTHLMHCLIVASGIEGDDLICTVKRATPAGDRAPVDFVQDFTPAGLLPRL